MMAGERNPAVVNGIVRSDIKMTGKTVLITGANTGIGLATAVDMAKREARVIMACRDLEKGNEARKKVMLESRSENICLKKLDLSSLESIRNFAKHVTENEARLDVLINNAGVMMCPQSKTKEGYEMQFGVNHLGHFLLTNLLLDLLKQSIPSRIVNVSSGAHRWGANIHWDDLNLEKIYTPTSAYAQSKLMNVLFSRELSRKLEGTGVTVYSLEPGTVRTDLQRHLGTHEHPTLSDYLMSLLQYLTRPWWKTPEQGAQTQIYCAVAPELDRVTGKYYRDCKEHTESSSAQNDEWAKKLWSISEEYTGIHPG